MPFKVGDIVQLKSGGPKMTVTVIFGPSQYPNTREGNLYRTSWFAGSKNEKGDFPEEALVDAKDDKPKS